MLTGAGISQESGLPTFRDKGGIWSRVRLEDVATAEAFRRNPAGVQAFYNMRRAAHGDPAIQPNEAHRALARLERDYPGDVLVVTQNVDDLHERAGSKALLHMHGAMNEVRCLECQAVTRWQQDIGEQSVCPHCGAAALRPNVVWFGETPFHLREIEAALARCGIFAAIGTSGQVYPAAGFINAVAGRARTYELTMERSVVSPLFDEVVLGPATLTVTTLVERLLAWSAAS